MEDTTTYDRCWNCDAPRAEITGNVVICTKCVAEAMQHCDGLLSQQAVEQLLTDKARQQRRTNR